MPGPESLLPSSSPFPGAALCVAAGTRPAGAAANAFLDSAEQRIAWARHRFFESGERPPGGWVGDAVLQSWQRCLDSGRRPDDVPVFEAVSAAQTRAALDRHRALLAAADPEIEQLARQLAGTGCMTLLTDRRGLAMRAIRPNGPSALLELSGRIGVDLGEPSFGGTAPGIAAADAIACSVSGAEHFFTALQQVHCVAAPIRNLRGELAGVLDLTMDGQPFGFDAASLVRLSALAIERRLVTGQLAARGHWQVHFHTRAEWLETAGAASVAFDEDGRIVWCNAAARALCPALEPSMTSASPRLGIDTLLSVGRGVLQSAPMHGGSGWQGGPPGPPGLARLPNGLGVWWRVQAPAALARTAAGGSRTGDAPNGVAAADPPSQGEATVEQTMLPRADSPPAPATEPVTMHSQGARAGTALGLERAPSAPLPTASPAPGATTLDAANRHWIESVLERHRGNISLAARELGVSRGLLYRRIRHWQLAPSSAGRRGAATEG